MVESSLDSCMSAAKSRDLMRAFPHLPSVLDAHLEVSGRTLYKKVLLTAKSRDLMLAFPHLPSVLDAHFEPRSRKTSVSYE